MDVFSPATPTIRNLLEIALYCRLLLPIVFIELLVLHKRDKLPSKSRKIRYTGNE